MVSVSDDTMAQEAASFLRLKTSKADIERRLAACEKTLRKGLDERHTMNGIFGGNVVRYVNANGRKVLRVDPESGMTSKPLRKDGIPF